MPEKLPKIVGINPGTRYLGIAVFEGGILLEWGVKVVKGKGSQKINNALAIVSDLVERWEPDIVAVKKLHPSRTSRNLDRMADAIVNQARGKRLKVRCYAIGELESFLCSDDGANRRTLAEVVAAMYPELKPELAREQTNRNAYHERMFEAVALATACFHQLEKQKYVQEQFTNPGHRPWHRPHGRGGFAESKTHLPRRGGGQEQEIARR